MRGHPRKAGHFEDCEVARGRATPRCRSAGHVCVTRRSSGASGTRPRQRHGAPCPFVAGGSLGPYALLRGEPESAVAGAPCPFVAGGSPGPLVRGSLGFVARKSKVARLLRVTNCETSSLSAKNHLNGGGNHGGIARIAGWLCNGRGWSWCGVYHPSCRVAVGPDGGTEASSCGEGLICRDEIDLNAGLGGAFLSGFDSLVQNRLEALD